MAAVHSLRESANLAADDLLLVDLDLHAWWQAAVDRTSREYDARSASTVVAKMVEATLARAGITKIDGLEPGDLDPDGWVPLTELLGSAIIPPDAAAVIADALVDGQPGWQQIVGWAHDRGGRVPVADPADISQDPADSAD
jgi:hypothetical protein